jgi:hypothetical protein
MQKDMKGTVNLKKIKKSYYFSKVEDRIENQFLSGGWYQWEGGGY